LPAKEVEILKLLRRFGGPGVNPTKDTVLCTIDSTEHFANGTLVPFAEVSVEN
jgi:hypothetical protein